MNLIFVRIKDIFLKEILEECPFLRVAMSKVPCLHEHLANDAIASSCTARVMVKNSIKGGSHDEQYSVRSKENYLY